MLSRIFLLGTSISRAAVIDDGFDCRLRHLALDYARDVVLKSWSEERAHLAAELVAEGLNLAECKGAQAAAGDSFRPQPGGTSVASSDLDTEAIFVSQHGDDDAAGTAEAPLRSIAGAQRRIRERWPNPADRPGISVLIRGGRYHDGTATFRPADSGSSPEHSIVYAAALASNGEAETVTLTGGKDLNAYGLKWVPAASPKGAFVAKVPENAATPDAQDQLFLSGVPLVRARVPNGRPWIPLDGFNLTAGRNFSATHTQMPDQPLAFRSCTGSSQWPDPPTVPRGKCGDMFEDVNLVGGLAASHLAGHVDNASGCNAICAADERCNFWTWHDSAQGAYALACYVRYDQTFHFESHSTGHTSGVCNHTLPAHPLKSDFPCEPATAVCKSTNSTQWPLGHASSIAYIGKDSAKDLGGSLIEVDECIQHPRTDKDWPLEWGAQTFGLVDKDNDTHVWMNKLDDTHNLPLWYGPWAGGMAIDTQQDAGGLDLRSLQWKHPEDVVVHAMADGEWGGCQFRVAGTPVQLSDSQAILRFQYGGWQQARGAMLYGDSTEQAAHGNRYYMEGSLDFLDAEGEWHFDSQSGSLYVFPPAELDLTVDTMAQQELLLTQVDRLFEFVGEDKARVRNIAIANLTLAYTSAQFFKPHEETSGGDYAVHRGAAVFAENAGNITVVGNTFKHIGGNAVFLSNAVGDVRVSSNLFRFVGTSGVSLVGRTGTALGDGRDGEAIVERHGKGRDNGVRLPRRNIIDHNIFTDWGIWDKQSACYHKAITAPDNIFLNNICFNASRHAVNYQDGMSGGGLVEGNLFFNLNRETKDTASFNSWGRRTYLTSDYDSDPAIPRVVPKTFNSIRRNFVLTRNYHSVGYQDNGNGLRCDDGATWYNFSSNVLYKADVEFNGGGQVWTHGNLFIRAGWSLCHHLTIGGSSFDAFVDPIRVWQGICGLTPCTDFWALPERGVKPAEYYGDHNTIANSAPGTVDWSHLYCGEVDLAAWRQKTQRDGSTVEVKDDAAWLPDAVVERARRQLREDITQLQPLKGLAANHLSSYITYV